MGTVMTSHFYTCTIYSIFMCLCVRGVCRSCFCALWEGAIKTGVNDSVETISDHCHKAFFLFLSVKKWWTLLCSGCGGGGGRGGFTGAHEFALSISTEKMWVNIILFLKL